MPVCVCIFFSGPLGNHWSTTSRITKCGYEHGGGDPRDRMWLAHYVTTGSEYVGSLLSI
jgi:putative component of membrane protein insertase Oxa1/YidC/SpoIIIJ protein YidD